MTDGQRLYAVLVAFYLLECLFWLPLGARYFWSWLGSKRWLGRKPSVNVAANGSGAAIAWPLPLLGGFFIADSLSIIPDEHGLWIGGDQPGSGTHLAWDDITPTTEQRTVLLGKGFRIKCATERRAQKLCAFILCVATAKPSKRTSLIEGWWKDQSDVRVAQCELDRFQQARSSLIWPCNALWVLCFVWIPLVYWWRGAEHLALWVAVAGMFMLMLSIAFTWRRIDRNWFPNTTHGRWLHFLQVMFMPTHSIRALDLLSVELFDRTHPLVVGKLLQSDGDWKDLAGKEWRYWRFCGPDSEMAASSAVVVPHLQSLFGKLGVDTASFETSPANDGSRSYCPRCQATYVMESANCRACGNVPTIPF